MTIFTACMTTFTFCDFESPPFVCLLSSKSLGSMNFFDKEILWNVVNT